MLDGLLVMVPVVKTFVEIVVAAFVETDVSAMPIVMSSIAG